MLPSVLHPVCMSKNYRCRKETKKKQAQRERVTQQSGAKHKWSICAFRNHPLGHRDALLRLDLVPFPPIRCFCRVTLPVPSERCIYKLQGDQQHAGWIKPKPSTSVCGAELERACSLGQVKGVSGLVGFGCRFGWPQQLYTQDKDPEWETTRSW